MKAKKFENGDNTLTLNDGATREPRLIVAQKYGPEHDEQYQSIALTPAQVLAAIDYMKSWLVHHGAPTN